MIPESDTDVPMDEKKPAAVVAKIVEKKHEEPKKAQVYDLSDDDDSQPFMAKVTAAAKTAKPAPAKTKAAAAPKAKAEPKATTSKKVTAPRQKKESDGDSDTNDERPGEWCAN